MTTIALILAALFCLGAVVCVAVLFTRIDKLRDELADMQHRERALQAHCIVLIRQRRIAEAKLDAALTQPVYGKQVVGRA